MTQTYNGTSGTPRVTSNTRLPLVPVSLGRDRNPPGPDVSSTNRNHVSRDPNLRYPVPSVRISLVDTVESIRRCKETRSERNKHFTPITARRTPTT